MPDEQHSVESYYDAHVGPKLAGYVDLNSRVEMAWRTVLSWAPSPPTRILEVGCGIGDICHRMSLAWPRAHIQGLDISPRSIEIATKLFGSDRVGFKCGYLTADTFEQQFDLVVMMDMYEHLDVAHRPGFHDALSSLLAPYGRAILSFPTPRHQTWIRRYQPERLQPVDEDIDIFTMVALASDLKTGVLYYSEVSVWDEGDYAHAVLGKRSPREPAAAAQKPGGFKSQVRGMLGGNAKKLRRIRRQIKDYVEIVRPRQTRWHTTRIERLQRIKDRLGDTFGLE